MIDGDSFKKTARQFGLCFLGGMYSVFLLAAFIPFPEGWFPQALGMALMLTVYSFINGTLILGILIAIALGLLGAKLYALAVAKQGTDLSAAKVKRIRLAFVFSLWISGMLLVIPIFHFTGSLISPKEHVWVVDMNRDGRIDKWVHNDRYDRLLEIDYDTNNDGKADIFEYYDKNGKLKQRTKEQLKR